MFQIDIVGDGGDDELRTDGYVDKVVERSS
jgi:hypothetical protein